MPQSIYDNGGINGVTLDLAATDRYVIGTTTVTSSPTAVSRYSIGDINGAEGEVPIDLTSFGLQEGDVILTARTIGDTGAELLVLPATSGYTTILDASTLFANGVYDVSAGLAYKVMGPTPDTEVQFPYTGSSRHGVTVNIVALRGLDPVTPFGTPEYALFTDSANALSFSPSLSTQTDNGALIYFGAYGDHDSTVSSISSSLLGTTLDASGLGSWATGFDTYASTAGLVVLPNTSPSPVTFPPDTWTVTQTTSSRLSVVMEARSTATSTPVYGNYKNSGIWNLSSVLEAESQKITFVGSTTFTNPYTANPQFTINFSSISGVAVNPGDLVFVIGGSGATFSLITSGYTVLANNIFGNDTVDTKLFVAYKYVTNDTSITIDMPGAGAGTAVSLYVWRNVGSVTAETATGIDTGEWNPPSVTAIADNSVVFCAGTSASVTTSYTAIPPSGYSKNTVTAEQLYASSPYGANIGIATKDTTINTGDSEDPGTWTGVSTSTSVGWAAITVALGPA